MQWNTDVKFQTSLILLDELNEVTEQHYYEMLEVLPPEALCKNAFLVGEPYSHVNGVPVFAGYVCKGDKYYKLGYMSEKTFASFLIPVESEVKTI